MTKTPDTYRTELTRGIYGRIANALGLGASGRAHVWRVAMGERQSPRVEKALDNEYRRINRAVQRYERSLQERAA